MTKKSNKTTNQTKKKSIDQRLEYVKIIVRTKASVCNWNDLEQQIMKGAL